MLMTTIGAHHPVDVHLIVARFRAWQTPQFLGPAVAQENVTCIWDPLTG
jgi:hypothetical protein